MKTRNCSPVFWNCRSLNFVQPFHWSRDSGLHLALVSTSFHPLICHCAIIWQFSLWFWKKDLLLFFSLRSNRKPLVIPAFAFTTQMPLFIAVLIIKFEVQLSLPFSPPSFPPSLPLSLPPPLCVSFPPSLPLPCFLSLILSLGHTLCSLSFQWHHHFWETLLEHISEQFYEAQKT